MEQELADYIRYLEFTSQYNTSQEEVDAFAREVNRNWRKQYENNKHRRGGNLPPE